MSEKTKEVVTKICPMRPIYAEDREAGQIQFYKCEREECAWWNDASKCCAVVQFVKGWSK